MCKSALRLRNVFALRLISIMLLYAFFLCVCVFCFILYCVLVKHVSCIVFANKNLELLVKLNARVNYRVPMADVHFRVPYGLMSPHRYFGVPEC